MVFVLRDTCDLHVADTSNSSNPSMVVDHQPKHPAMPEFLPAFQLFQPQLKDSKAFKKDFKIDIKTLTDEHVVPEP